MILVVTVGLMYLVVAAVATPIATLVVTISTAVAVDALIVIVSPVIVSTSYAASTPPWMSPWIAPSEHALSPFWSHRPHILVGERDSVVFVVNAVELLLVSITASATTTATSVRPPWLSRSLFLPPLPAFLSAADILRWSPLERLPAARGGKC